MYRYLILIVLFVWPAVVFAGSESGRIHPDEPVEYTEEVRFSLENAGESLKEIEKILSTFRELTDTIRSGKNVNIKNFAYTDWEMQNLGFPNMVVAIEGALLKQNYLIKKAECELAREKRKTTSISAEEFAGKLEEYQEAKRKYKKFWSDTTISD